VGGNDPLVAAALAAAEVKLLTRKLAAADKQIAALKDVFNKRVKAFRDSVRQGTASTENSVTPTPGPAPRQSTQLRGLKLILCVADNAVLK
jgi:hypothetical protein